MEKNILIPGQARRSEGVPKAIHVLTRSKWTDQFVWHLEQAGAWQEADLCEKVQLTNSDLKVSVKGKEYITIYFERPNADGSDFISMQIDYPDMTPQKVIGFTETEIPSLLFEAEKIGDIALLRAQEDAYANLCFVMHSDTRQYLPTFIDDQK